MLPYPCKKHYDILLRQNKESNNMNHFTVSESWLQEIIKLFGDTTDKQPNPFKNVFYRCSVKCPHCGYIIGNILVAFLDKATIFIWDKNNDTDILQFNPINWSLVDIDLLSQRERPINEIPCLSLPKLSILSVGMLTALRSDGVLSKDDTSRDMLCHWFSDALSERGSMHSSKLALTDKLYFFESFLRDTRLGTVFISSSPSSIIFEVGDVSTPGSGILLILNRDYL